MHLNGILLEDDMEKLLATIVGDVDSLHAEIDTINACILVGFC